MQTDALWPQQLFIEELTETPEVPGPVEAPLGDDDIARSEQNILQWMEYLPTDCIQTMILMGWDIST